MIDYNTALEDVLSWTIQEVINYLKTKDIVIKPEDCDYSYIQEAARLLSE